MTADPANSPKRREPLSPAERQRRARHRKRLGLVRIELDIPEDVLAELWNQGRVTDLSDHDLISESISELIEDAIRL